MYLFWLLELLLCNSMDLQGMWTGRFLILKMWKGILQSLWSWRMTHTAVLCGILVSRHCTRWFVIRFPYMQYRLYRPTMWFLIIFINNTINHYQWFHTVGVGMIMVHIGTILTPHHYGNQLGEVFSIRNQKSATIPLVPFGFDTWVQFRFQMKRFVVLSLILYLFQNATIQKKKI